MSTNSKKIEEILDKRLGRNAYAGQGRLQKIESKIRILKNVLEKVTRLDSLIGSIGKEIEQGRGDYFRLLSMDPEASMRFREVSCSAARAKLQLVIRELEKLKSRFSRQALRIAFIGRERQGKSTFLKTITGLDDKVIPAYSGNSCTGAVSVIHHVSEESQWHVDVEYFTVQEFIQTVKDKLAKFFPNENYIIRQLSDIQHLQLPEHLKDANVGMITEYNKFKDTYIDHYDEYCHLVGNGVVSYNDKDVIAQHVAQYEEFNTQVEGSFRVVKDDGRVVYQLNYYKYVAVKNVDIYTPFQVPDTDLLELVDTIGIGGSADTHLVIEEMFRVLREDCDAAIDLFRPENTANYPVEQTELLDSLWTRLSDRDPSKWIVYVVNKATSDPFKNTAAVSGVMPVINNALEGNHNKRPVAWAKDIDGTNLEEVSDLLINPLLDLIAENLDSLDGAMMVHANELSNEAYNQCLTLVKAANAVTSASVALNADILSLFDEKLFKTLHENFGYALNKVDDLGYAKMQEKSCYQLECEYNNIIDDLDLYIPEEEDLLKKFMTGAGLTPRQVFEDAIEQMRNDVFSAFENVNETVLLPLQEKVKTDLINILYNEGRMRYLPVESGSQEASVGWLREVIDNYVDESTYPNLYKALKFILDYQINIEGLVEYNVTRALYPIDRSNREFIPYRGEFTDDFEEKASNVWQEMCNRLSPISERLRSWIGDFTLIPSHSFYSRVHKFHIKVMTDRGGCEDFRRFYRKNMSVIWSEEVMSVSATEKAFGEWNDRVKALQAEIVNENFKIG